MKSCKNCRFFINDRIPFITKYGYCALTRQTVPTIVDPATGETIVYHNTYRAAIIERGVNGACRPEALLHQYEPNPLKRWCNQHYGTVYFIMMMNVYIILMYLVCLIVTQIIYFF